VVVSGLGTVYTRNATLPVPPASNEKIFTGLTALRVLGPDRRYLTELRHSGTLSGDTLTGDLVLLAGGDPTLTRADLADLARQVQARGVRTVTGRLLVDDSRYDRVRNAPGWKSTWVPWEVGPLSALAVEKNQWRTDDGYVANPAQSNLHAFWAELARVGVAVRGGSGFGTAPATRLAVHVGPRVDEVVTYMMKHSDNFYAEMLLKELGRGTGQGSTAAGAKMVRDWSAYARTPVHTYVDGSGLSAYDRQTAAGEVAYLTVAQGSGHWASFRAALPIACRDGTLGRRLCGSSTYGKVFAKTGTLSGVAALAGYTTTASGRSVVFSFMLSRGTSITYERAAIDRAVAAIASFTG
jgi:D-alanyl-D-alanine carboxypeptidase/D-alanyl-D-alanine-endopeptidase (penicillin-binding protein 4)